MHLIVFHWSAQPLTSSLPIPAPAPSHRSSASLQPAPHFTSPSFHPDFSFILPSFPLPQNPPPRPNPPMDAAPQRPASPAVPHAPSHVGAVHVGSTSGGADTTARNCRDVGARARGSRRRQTDGRTMGRLGDGVWRPGCRGCCAAQEEIRGVGTWRVAGTGNAKNICLKSLGRASNIAIFKQWYGNGSSKNLGIL